VAKAGQQKDPEDQQFHDPEWFKDKGWIRGANGKFEPPASNQTGQGSQASSTPQAGAAAPTQARRGEPTKDELKADNATLKEANERLETDKQNLRSQLENAKAQAQNTIAAYNRYERLRQAIFLLDGGEEFLDDFDEAERQLEIQRQEEALRIQREEEERQRQIAQEEQDKEDALIHAQNVHPNAVIKEARNGQMWIMDKVEVDGVVTYEPLMLLAEAVDAYKEWRAAQDRGDIVEAEVQVHEEDVSIPRFLRRPNGESHFEPRGHEGHPPFTVRQDEAEPGTSQPHENLVAGRARTAQPPAEPRPVVQFEGRKPVAERQPEPKPTSGWRSLLRGLAWQSDEKE